MLSPKPRLDLSSRQEAVANDSLPSRPVLLQVLLQELLQLGCNRLN